MVWEVTVGYRCRGVSAGFEAVGLTGPETYPELLKDVRVFPGPAEPGFTRHCAPGCGGREGGAQPRTDLPPAGVVVSAHWLPYGSTTCSLKSLFLCPGTCGHWPQHPESAFNNHFFVLWGVIIPSLSREKQQPYSGLTFVS